MDIHVRNNIQVFGQGSQPMIFAHGFGCGQHMWRYLWPAFERDFKIVLFDYVGSGGSDVNAYNAERYASLDGYSQDVIEICEELDLRDSIFVGHSVSGMIGAIASVKRPDFFSRLVMIGPSPCYINGPDYVGGFNRSDIDELLQTMEKNYIGWANALAPAIMGHSDRPELGQELQESFCSTDPFIARQFAQVTFLSDNRHDLKNVKHPSLILQCSQDLIAPNEVGSYLEENLPGAVQIVMNATGHCPHLSAPEETIELIRQYLGLQN